MNDLLSWNRHYNVLKLQSNPVVKTVSHSNIEFTLSFMIHLFERWKSAPGPETITMALAEEDILFEDIPDTGTRKSLK